MAVNLSKNNLCINQIIEQKNEKITIESDEIVPDIKPDVLSIISSSGNICLHKKEGYKERIFVSLFYCLEVMGYVTNNEK